MPVGYFDNLSDANSYFENERFGTEAWDDLTDDAIKTKAVENAYNRIYYDPRWSLPTHAEASALILSELQKANAEMAYYLAQHLEDEDRRKGLQAQGVIAAGITKEQYSETHLMDLPVPPFVIAILKPWSTERYYKRRDGKIH